MYWYAQNYEVICEKGYDLLAILMSWYGYVGACAHRQGYNLQEIFHYNSFRETTSVYKDLRYHIAQSRKPDIVKTAALGFTANWLL